MKLDLNGAQAILDYLQHQTNKGNLHVASVSGTIGAAGTIALSITTPDTTKKTCLSIAVNANKAGNFIVAEGDVITGGSSVTAYNMNRNSAVTYGGTLTKDATRSTPGTTMKTTIVGAPGVFAWSDRPGAFMKLLGNTTYTILFTADGASTAVSIEVAVYEE
jgi:hypothetical protein